jgi:cobalt-zinc-cadmium efflux system outer membrane protein
MGCSTWSTSAHRHLTLEPALVMIETAPRQVHKSAEGDIAAVNFEGPAPPSGPMKLEDLFALALDANPDLAIARARAEVARAKLVQAGLYPNPTVGIDAQQIGLNKKEGQPSGFFAQEIVTNGKLDLAQAAASHGIEAADWQAITQWYDVTARIRAAFYEVLTAQREVKVSEEVLEIAKVGLDTNERLAKAGQVGQPDVLRARVELTQSENRLQIAQQRLAASWKLMATAVGQPDLRLTSLDGDLDEELPAYEYEPLVASVLARSSVLQEARAGVLQAQRELDLAVAQVCPNLTVGLTPGYDYGASTPILTAAVSVPVPVFNRNQGNIMAARAEITRATRTVQQAQVRLTEQLATAYQRYEASRKTVSLFEKKVVPDATESLRLIRLAFDAGDPKFDFNAVLDAQRTLANARLSLIQARGEIWQAVSQIEGLLQRDAVPLPLPHRSCP